jgi:hypothetical protein
MSRDLRSAAKLLGGHVSGDQILCPAPGHSPKDRSLAVKFDDKAPEGFLTFGHARDDWKKCRDHVREKLGLKSIDGGKRIVATYDYVDETGELISQVVRYFPKEFRQRRPDGKGGWIWKLGDVRRVPYRLPQILDVIHAQPIFIVEGEKDADALTAGGIAATWNAGGAGNWKAEHSAALRGADVVIIPDADEAGEDHLNQVAASLDGVASRIRVLRLPGVKDAYDWIAAGGTAEKLWQLVETAEEAPAPASSSSTTPEPKPSGGGDLGIIWASTIEPEPIDWLWDGYLARGKITLISGRPETGKSQIGTDWIARVTTGRNFPQGARPPIGFCFILSAEDGAKDTIRPRLEAAGADLDKVAILTSVTTGEGKTRTFSLQTDLERLAAEFARLPADYPPLLLQVDPVTAYLGNDIDSHRTTDVRSALAPLEAFAEQHKIGVVSITHPRKGTSGNAIDSITGSLAFVAAPRLAFVTAIEPETGRLLFLPIKNNIGPKARGRGYRITTETITNQIIAPRVRWDDAPVDVTADEALYQMAQAAKGAGDGPREQAKEFLLDQLKDGPKPQADVTAAARAASISEITLKRARRDLGVTAAKDGYQGAWTLALPTAKVIPFEPKGDQ